MSSDVQLDNDWVVVEGNWTRVRTWDLMLDAADRRTSPQGWRRAMVHDHGDKLSINYGGDYPGGVDIRGALALEQVKVITSLECAGDLGCHGNVKCDNLLTAASLVVKDAADFERAAFQQPIQVPDITITPAAAPMPLLDPQAREEGMAMVAAIPYSLLDKIAGLQSQITELTYRVHALEAGNS